MGSETRIVLLPQMGTSVACGSGSSTAPVGHPGQETCPGLRFAAPSSTDRRGPSACPVVSTASLFLPPPQQGRGGSRRTKNSSWVFVGEKKRGREIAMLAPLSPGTSIAVYRGALNFMYGGAGARARAYGLVLWGRTVSVTFRHFGGLKVSVMFSFLCLYLSVSPLPPHVDGYLRAKFCPSMMPVSAESRWEKSPFPRGCSGSEFVCF